MSEGIVTHAIAYDAIEGMGFPPMWLMCISPRREIHFFGAVQWAQRQLKIMGIKGEQSQRDRGEYYDEVKSEQVILLMTPTGKARLDKLAVCYELSRSEFVEQIAREMIPINKRRRKVLPSV